MKELKSILWFLFFFVFSLALVGGVFQLIKIFLPEFNNTLVALIAFSGTVIAALIKNYYDKINLMEAELRAEKQKNYNDLLENLGKYIRDPDTQNDIFITIHLKSWIYGSKEIIAITSEMVRLNRENNLSGIDENIRKLLAEMRKDVGLISISKDTKLVETFIEYTVKKRGV